MKKHLSILAAAFLAAAALPATSLQDLQVRAQAVAKRAGASADLQAKRPVHAALRGQTNVVTVDGADAVLEAAIQSALSAAARRGIPSGHAGGGVLHARTVLTALAAPLAELKGQAASAQRDAALNLRAAELVDAARSVQSSRWTQAHWGKRGALRSDPQPSAEAVKLEIAGLLLDRTSAFLDLL